MPKPRSKGYYTARVAVDRFRATSSERGSFAVKNTRHNETTKNQEEPV